MNFKRILAMLLSVMMVFSLLPVTALAEEPGEEPPVQELPLEVQDDVQEEVPDAVILGEDTEPVAIPQSDPVAEVNGTQYDSFAAAVEAAAGTSTIVLLANIADYTLTAGQTLIVNKGSYTLSVYAPAGYQLNTADNEGVITYTLTQYAAQIGSEYYLSVVAAVAAVPASGADFTEIKLLCTSTETATVTLNNAQKVRLDLNGNTLQTDGNRKMISVKGGSTLEIVDNSATGTGKIYGNGKTSIDGQGISITSGAVYLKSGTIDGCTTKKTTSSAEVGGAGVRVNGDDAAFYMQGGKISNCATTEVHGAAILVSKGSCTITGGTICNNTVPSGKYGAGIRCAGGTTTVSGGVFYGNKATSETFTTNLSKYGDSTTLSFTGGWFSKAVTDAYLPAGYVKSGECVNAPNKNAPHTIFPADADFTVTYDLDGDTTTVAPTTQDAGTAFTLSQPTGLGDNDVFSGWFLDSDMSGTALSGDLYFAGSVTVYGHVESGITGVASVTIEGTTQGYSTFAEAATAAGNTNVITLLANIDAAYEMSAGQTLMVKKSGFTLTVNPPTGYSLNAVAEDGVTTYTLTQYVAKIGSEYYLTLVKAVEAVPALGSNYTEIVLLADTEEKATIALDNGKMVRLDLNGHTLQPSGNRKTITIKGASTLEIVDNSTLKNGKIYGNEKTSSDGQGIYITSGTVYLKSGTIDGCTATGTAGGGGIRVNADEGANAAFYMSGGKITGCTATKGNGGAILVSSGYCEISGGTICNNSADTEGKYGGGVRVQGGEAVISGGYFYGNKVNNEETFSAQVSKGSDASCTISGGWFSQEIAYYKATGCTSAKVISGVDAQHTFPVEAPYTIAKPVATITYDKNGGSAAALPEAKTGVVCVPGYNIENPTPVKLSTKYPFCSDKVFVCWNTKDDGTGTDYLPGSETLICTGDITLYAKYRAAEATDYVASIGGTSFTTLAEALTVLNDGDTLTLSNNVIENLVISKNITLDLNGYGLTGSGIGSALSIGSADNTNIAVTIQDSSNPSKGYIYGEAQSSGGAIDNYGTLTIKSGSFSGYAPSYGAAVYNRGTLTIEGGTFSYAAASKDETRTEPGVDQAVYSNGSAISVTITGGTFDGTISKGSKNTTTTIGISGGTFSTDPTAFVETDICDVNQTSTSPIQYTVIKQPAAAKIGDKEYKSADVALKAAKSGDMVVCYSDAAVSAEVKSGVALDLNGYTLSGSFTNKGEIFVYDNNSLTAALAAGNIIHIEGGSLTTADFTVPEDTSIYKSGSSISFTLPSGGVVDYTGDVTGTVTVSGAFNVPAGKSINVSGTISANAITGGTGSGIALKEGAELYFNEDIDENLLTVNYPYFFAYASNPVSYQYNIYLDTRPLVAPKHEVNNVIIKVGETYQFNYNDRVTEWNAVLDWSSSDESVATVAGGLVTAVAPGTAIISVEGESFRVDVAADPVKADVQGVELEASKTTVELYKTDYTKLEVFVKLGGAAILADKGDYSTYEMPEDAENVAIEKVSFANAKTGEAISAEEAAAIPFKAVVVDDRYVEFVPIPEMAEQVYNGQLKIKGSYKYQLVVTIDGKDFNTEALTISVKKSTPKIKASAVTICSLADYSDYGFTKFTGGQVEDVYLYTPAKKTAAPEWVVVEDDTVYFDSDLNEAEIKLVDGYFEVGAKASGVVYLQCEVDGWAVTCPVAVKVSVVNKAPSVTVKAVGTIENLLNQSQLVLTPTVKNGTPNGYSFDIYSVVGKSETLLDHTDKDNFPFDWKWDDDGILTIKQNLNNKPAAGSYKAVLTYYFGLGNSVEAKAVKFTVKATTADKLKVTFAQSTKTENIFKNDKADSAKMVLSYEGQALAGLKQSNIQLDAKMAALFDFSYNEDTGVITVFWKETADRAALKAGAKTLKFSIFVDGNVSTKANATVSLKLTVK